ncbi:hypothetical protein L195_g063415, partial [Trifolium pratense]
QTLLEAKIDLCCGCESGSERKSRLLWMGDSCLVVVVVVIVVVETAKSDAYTPAVSVNGVPSTRNSLGVIQD